MQCLGNRVKFWGASKRLLRSHFNNYIFFGTTRYHVNTKAGKEIWQLVRWRFNNNIIAALAIFASDFEQALMFTCGCI
ncbi:hypothetical protein SE17_23035 [Kouleothrix aurantiaca]|uniref:Uncharacterized protein n=1 Tax=Kouleothrix aurantiaca TaxID=186479 RepID=A0A0P9DM52_9CHLR|nr:hypothetical protein SE17_23035 [Kouleothrix aurantiaca]